MRFAAARRTRTFVLRSVAATALVAAAGTALLLAVSPAPSMPGFDDVRGLRIGKLIEVEVDAVDSGQARARVDEMCRRLLANTILEDYTVEAEPAERLAPPGAVR